MSYNPEYHRAYYQLNKEKRNTPEKKAQNAVVAKLWRQSNREANMLSAAKSRAKKNGLDFNIEIEDIVIPETCPIIGIPLQFTDGKQNEGTPALDRIDNTKGYVKGNVQVISHKANRHKADLTLEQIEALYLYCVKKLT